MSDNIFVFNQQQTSGKQKVIIENVEANLTKQGKQLSVPLDTNMETM